MSTEMIPVRFEVEVGIPPKGDIDGANLTLKSQMPFVPHAGMWLVAIEGDDFRKVESIYWSKEFGLEVFFKFEEVNQKRLNWLKALGWEEVK